jgi:hypothetical protein
LHSEAGAISRRAIEGLSHDQQELLKKHLFLYAIGPMLPIPMHYAFKALNIYSKQDFLGIGGYLLGLGGRALAQSLYGASGCSIDFIPCLSSWGDRSLLVVDHAFLGSTYALALQNQIQQWRKKYRLYDGRNP